MDLHEISLSIAKLETNYLTMIPSEKLLFDARYVASKLISLQEHISKLNLYDDIEWLKSTSYFIREHQSSIHPGKQCLQAELLSELAKLLETNLKIAEQNIEMRGYV